MITREDWEAYTEARHERRIEIIHADWTDEGRARAYERDPRKPTHRIRYTPTFEITLEIAPYEDADEVCSRMVNERQPRTHERKLD